MQLAEEEVSLTESNPETRAYYDVCLTIRKAGNKLLRMVEGLGSALHIDFLRGFALSFSLCARASRQTRCNH